MVDMPKNIKEYTTIRQNCKQDWTHTEGKYITNNGCEQSIKEKKRERRRLRVPNEEIKAQP